MHFYSNTLVFKSVINPIQEVTLFIFSIIMLDTDINVGKNLLRAWLNQLEVFCANPQLPLYNLGR